MLVLDENTTEPHETEVVPAEIELEVRAPTVAELVPQLKVPEAVMAAEERAPHVAALVPHDRVPVESIEVQDNTPVVAALVPLEKVEPHNTAPWRLEVPETVREAKVSPEVPTESTPELDETTGPAVKVDMVIPATVGVVVESSIPVLEAVTTPAPSEVSVRPLKIGLSPGPKPCVGASKG